jgi:hypothetical protein
MEMSAGRGWLSGNGCLRFCLSLGFTCCHLDTVGLARSGIEGEHFEGHLYGVGLKFALSGVYEILLRNLGYGFW